VKRADKASKTAAQQAAAAADGAAFGVAEASSTASEAAFDRSLPLAPLMSLDHAKVHATSPRPTKSPRGTPRSGTDKGVAGAGLPGPVDRLDGRKYRNEAAGAAEAWFSEITASEAAHSATLVRRVTVRLRLWALGSAGNLPALGSV
jgi:hypothetical protein